MQVLMECETEESEGGYTKHVNLGWPKIYMYKVGQISTESNKFIQCFNQENSSHGIYYCESFTGSKFDVKYVNTVKQKICRCF